MIAKNNTKLLIVKFWSAKEENQTSLQKCPHRHMKGRRRAAWSLFVVFQSRIKSVVLEKGTRDSAPAFLSFPHSDSCSLRPPDFPFPQWNPSPSLFSFVPIFNLPHTASHWKLVLSLQSLVLAHSCPFKWLSGWSQPFQHPPDPQPGGEGAQILDCCPQPLRPPHTGLLGAANRNCPPEQRCMGESITPLQSPLYGLMLKKNVLEFSPRFLSE